MTYQQYSDHIKLCAYLGKEPQGEFKVLHDFITGLWKDMEFTVVDNYNNQGNGHTIIFHKGTYFYMEQDSNIGYLWCHPDRVWSFFQNKRGFDLPEIQDFIQSMVVEHFKREVSTPHTQPVGHVLLVEEHLKNKAPTPVEDKRFIFELVEEYLKHKLETPLTTSMNYLCAKLVQWWKNISRIQNL
jgi:hypothetical protein